MADDDKAHLQVEDIGFSPFGLDYSSQPFPPAAPAAAGAPAGAAREPQDALAPTAQNYKLIAGMMREVARLNFEGKLQTAVEEKGTATDTLKFGAWNAVVSYGAGRRGAPAGNAEPTGRVLVAQTGENQFLVTGFGARVDFRPAEPNKRRQFMRVDEGTYDNGAFKFLRILNGDETDNGLNFRSEPVALHVSLGVY